jgi:hypothetical protein
LKETEFGAKYERRSIQKKRTQKNKTIEKAMVTTEELFVQRRVSMGHRRLTNSVMVIFSQSHDQSATNRPKIRNLQRAIKASKRVHITPMQFSKGI